MSMDKPLFETVQAYINAAPPHARAHLETLRALVRAAATQAREIIRYDMPGYYLGDKPLCYVAAAKTHASLHVGREPLQQLAGELAGYKTTKGSVHFPYDRPIAEALVKALVTCRLNQRDAQARKP